MLDQETVLSIKTNLELEKNKISQGLRNRLKDLVLDRTELTELADHSREEMSFFEKINSGVREVNRLRKLKAAIRRIEEGSYGECIECGHEIREVRLRANPVSLKCIYCQEDEENKRKGFPVSIGGHYAAV